MVPAMDAPSLVLEALTGPAAGRRVELGATGEIRVGRSPDVTLYIPNDSAISRNHFSIEATPKGYVASDLGSANGTELNGEPLRGRVALFDGDRLEAGHSTFVVQVHVVLPALGTPDNADPELHRFPGYQILETIGEGNMGAVHLVERESDGQRFALKCLRPDLQIADTDARRFLREAAAMRALTHRNIVAFVDEGFVGGEFFFVMEYVEGVDLDLYRRQAGGRIAPRRAVDLVSELLDGLHYAHERGFVHRDVKPANILVGIDQGKMVPKLTDFGLAKNYEEVSAQPITRGKIAFGTPDYMPPEQITRFRDVGPRSDIYSAGAALYHILCGETVYAGVGGEDPIRTLLEQDPKPLRERARSLPPELCDVVHRALMRSPADRYPTAAAFRAALLAVRDQVL